MLNETGHKLPKIKKEKYLDPEWGPDTLHKDGGTGKIRTI